MKEEILSIASDLREGFITSNEARNQLLRLFGVMRPALESVSEGELLQGEAVAKSVSVDKCKVCGADISNDNFYGLCKLHW